MPVLEAPHFVSGPQDPSSVAGFSDVAQSVAESSGEIGSDRESSLSDSLSEADLESGDLTLKKLHLGWDCRICHLGPEGGSGGGGHDCRELIQLGCSCKGDLGAAHKKCAETWFKIRGNMTCEICGATAVNVAGEQTNQTNISFAATHLIPTGPMILLETRPFWHGRRIINFLLACMIFAFVISWLFHFKVLS